MSKIDPITNNIIKEWESINKIRKEIALNVHKEEWIGPHEDANIIYYVKDKSKHAIVKGIIL